MLRILERRLAWLALSASLALAGCGLADIPMAPAIPASEGPDPTLAETPVQADAVMTCETIATERSGIKASLDRLDGSAAAASLRQRDAALTRLAAVKGCAP